MFSVQYNFSCSSNTASSNASGQYVVVKTERNKNTNFVNFVDELKRVKTSQSMKEFLENHVSWTVRIYEVYISDTNVSKNSNQLFYSHLCAPCKNPQSVVENIDYYFFFYLDKFYILILIFGLVCIFGNGTTIAHELYALMKRKVTPAKEQKIHHILVLNLCLADLLIGVYLVMSLIARKIDPENVNFCNALGVISKLSMQSSATILTIITAYRLKSIIFPYKLVSTKLPVILLVIVWFAWAVVVSFPLFNEALFGHEFTSAIIVNDGAANIELHKLITTIQTLAQTISCTVDEPFRQLLKALRNFQNNDVTIQLLKSFNLVDFEQVKIDFVDYYDIEGGCTFQFIFEANKTSVEYFSLFILFLNFGEYLFIFIAYIVIIINISTKKGKRFFHVFLNRILFKEEAIHEKLISKTNKFTPYFCCCCY